MLRTLADPYLVARFQRLCGLKEKKPKESNFNEDRAPCNGARSPHINGFVGKRNGFCRNGYSIDGYKNGYHAHADEMLKNGLVKNGYVRPEEAEGDTMSLNKDFENLFKNINKVVYIFEQLCELY